MIRPKIFLFIIVALLAALPLSAQDKARIFGKVTDNSLNPIPGATVLISGSLVGTSTDANGKFSMSIPANEPVKVEFRFIGKKTQTRDVNLRPGDSYEFKITLNADEKVLTTFDVYDEQNRDKPMEKIDPKVANKVPTVNGSISGILTTQAAGVVNNNELSSNYSVRGGNFDENLVYVNDILIYRPFLVRSGQQEGLSFVNSDLVENVEFSSGGFEARFGDKMSSVLDVKYKKPKEWKGSVMSSLLGAAAHAEGTVKDSSISILTGVRYRTNRYLLGSLNTQGDYQPSFVDAQLFLTFHLSEKVEWDVLGNYSRNRYLFVPESRETDFGTVNEALRLTVFFDGQEVSNYETALGATSLSFKPKPGLNLKLIGSAFRTQEQETFDVEGAYRLDELERDLSQDNFGGVAFNRGVGAFLNHARNFLDATVLSAEHKGTYQVYENQWLWGLKYQHDIINDELSEWEMVDSNGFSIPQNPANEIRLRDVTKVRNEVQTNRFSGYLQYNRHLMIDSSELTLLAGMRFNYWDFSGQLLGSPRISASLKPARWKRDWVFNAAFGFYHQPPFYREMRNLFGEINPNIKAQTSIHYVLTGDYNFEAWDRPFKLKTALYYKQLRNIIPYELENVRIRYFAENNADGYATGLDFNLNGQFVKGVDSYVSMSIMQTREDIQDDFFFRYLNASGEQIIFGFSEDQVATDSVKVEPGFIPRPTDQRVNFGLFFQDYLRGREWLKMHLNLLWGSGLPFGPPDNERFKDTLRIPPYRRVDIGFSAQLLSPPVKGEVRNPKSPFKHFDNIWLSLEVFNLLQVNNTISYLWVRDISDREYAIPNYLTARRVNLKLIAEF